ncbi:H-type lectin domain-containing protein [Actinomyces polynesiensis]|uniref:H-type lectin domain-containing protein n=1 Tax=Actinomyces polynesiensis TaxID=1325934 RepID=UPI0005B768FA|nr:H-type lectin domain-containing protein [Actinomyces polynesiensis]
MPSATSKGVPYPLPADNRGAYPTEVGKPLAEWIDAKTPQRGSVAGSSAMAADATNTFTVTFPRPFATPPTVIVGSDNSRVATEAKNITTTGFNLAARNVSAGPTSGPVTYAWIALAS